MMAMGDSITTGTNKQLKIYLLLFINVLIYLLQDSVFVALPTNRTAFLSAWEETLVP